MEIIMKKLLSFALATAMLLSIFTLTACGKKTVKVENITKPGTYELTKENVSQYIRAVENGYGEGRTYISKLSKYGYTDSGFELEIFCQYLYPSELTDVKITYEVRYMYDMQLSFDTAQTFTSEPVTITVELNKTGKTVYQYAASVADSMTRNTYCKYALNPKVASVDIKEVSGSITFLPR